MKFIINEMILKMKTKKNIHRLAEPLVYIVLVAAFGFITTVVNHSQQENQVTDTELVSLTFEDELEALFYQEETGVSL